MSSGVVAGGEMDASDAEKRRTKSSSLDNRESKESSSSQQRLSRKPSPSVNTGGADNSGVEDLGNGIGENSGNSSRK